MAKRRIIFIGLLIPVVLFLLRGAVYYIYSFPIASVQGFDATFESTDLSEWDSLGAKQLCCPHSAEFVNGETSSDDYAVKVTLKRDDPDVRGAKRAEFRLKSSQMGRDYWYAFSTFVPKDWESDSIPVTIAQWHGTPDKILGEGGRYPPLSLDIVENQFRILSVSDQARISATSLIDFRSDTISWSTLWTGTLETGKWINWLFHVRWSSQHDGLTQVWKNEVPIIQVKGPNSYNDFLGPYFKLGVYIPRWKKGMPNGSTTVRSVMFDDIHVREGECSLGAICGFL